MLLASPNLRRFTAPLRFLLPAATSTHRDSQAFFSSFQAATVLWYSSRQQAALILDTSVSAQGTIVHGGRAPIVANLSAQAALYFATRSRAPWTRRRFCSTVHEAYTGSLAGSIVANVLTMRAGYQLEPARVGLHRATRFACGTNTQPPNTRYKLRANTTLRDYFSSCCSYVLRA